MSIIKPSFSPKQNESEINDERKLLSRGVLLKVFVKVFDHLLIEK
jgi:hypothetical protein